MVTRNSGILGVALALVLLTLGTVSTALAVDSADAMQPKLVSVALAPDQATQGKATVARVTAVFSDDESGITPTGFELRSCSGQQAIGVSPTPAPELVSSVADPFTGEVKETWAASILIPANAALGEYWAWIGFRDADGNAQDTGRQGPSCRHPSAVVGPQAVFTMNPSGPEPDKDPGGWAPSQITPTDNPLLWSRATLKDKVKIDEFGRRPVKDRDKRMFVLACERDIQLDCVESVGLVDEAGVYRPGTFKRGITFDVTHRVSQGIKPYAEHHTIWDVPGLIIEGQEPDLDVVMAFGGGGTWEAPGMSMGLNLTGLKLLESSPTDPMGCRYLDTPGRCVKEPPFPEGTTLRFVIRTSWVAPSLIAIRGKNVSAEVEQLDNGARRVTITGDPTMLQSGGGKAEVDAGRPEWVASTFDFTLFDPRVDKSPGGDCTANEPLVVASNAGAGRPEWREQQGRLDLRLEAPHYWADGKREWRGHYETVISKKSARCLWGVNPEVVNYLSLEVYNEDGEEKAATTAIGYKDGLVSIRAYDFTFSTNVVSAKVKVKAGRQCFTSGVRIGDLTCAKRGSKLIWVKGRR